MTSSLEAISKRIEGLTKRMVQDTIVYHWIDTEKEEVIDFTNIWREFSLSVWGRSVDTISEALSSILIYAPKGTFISKHFHYQNQTIFVAEGDVRVYINGDSTPVAENAMVAIPAKIPHSILFLKESIIFCKFEPREVTPIKEVVVAKLPVEKNK